MSPNVSALPLKADLITGVPNMPPNMSLLSLNATPALIVGISLPSWCQLSHLVPGTFPFSPLNPLFSQDDLSELSCPTPAITGKHFSILPNFWALGRVGAKRVPQCSVWEAALLPNLIF